MPIFYQPGLDVTNPASAGNFDGLTVMINTINAKNGVMGAGIAKTFAEKWPVMPIYRNLATNGHIYGGDLRLLHAEGDIQILGMATKEDVSNPSKHIWVGAGMLRLAHYLKDLTDTGRKVRVLMPQPGCGNGGLDFSVVNRMIRSILGHSAAEIVISVKDEAEANLISARNWRPIYAGIGSRRTPSSELGRLTELGMLMAAKGFRLHSGGAEGPDQAFEAGYDAWRASPNHNPARDGGKAIYVASRNAQDGHIPYYPWPAMLGIAAAINPLALQLGLTPDVVEGREPPDGPAALMARNGHQVFGDDFTRIIDCGIGTTPGALGDGGSGQFFRLCKLIGIDYIDVGGGLFHKASPQEIAEESMSRARARSDFMKQPAQMRNNTIRTPVVTGSGDIDLIDRDDDAFLGDDWTADTDGNVVEIDEGFVFDSVTFGGSELPSQIVNSSDQRKKERRAEIRAMFDAGDRRGAVLAAIKEGARTYGAVALTGGLQTSDCFREVRKLFAEGLVVNGVNGVFELSPELLAKLSPATETVDIFTLTAEG